MNRDTCNKFDSCAAPICPLCSEEENKNYTWFGDEEVCTKHNPQFVKTQKKIVKKSQDISTYYTYEMLNRNFMIKEGITGLNPDIVEFSQLKKWLQGHKIGRKLTEEERLKRSEYIKAYNTGQKASVTISETSLSKAKFDEKT